ncbi:MAG: class 1 fructose-bisphosphatase [Pseudodonghicola sp.]|nr:class 1 fructose-bisphosphatase [Pseudodonghicola sp.]
MAPAGMIPAQLEAPMQALSRVASDLAQTIARGPLEGALGVEVGSNSDGDNQKALDVMADEAFAAALPGTGVRWYASEEQETVQEIDADGALALAIDPLDGSSNIDVNVTIGTIFSILPALEGADESFLRSGRDQIAAGYFIYGPMTALVVTFGDGVFSFVRDPQTGRFVQVGDRMKIPATSSEFAINASNYHQWSKPVRAYIDDCLLGLEGPRAKNFNMRWVASLVAEAHRILSRGGIFLYPSDSRPGYEQGRLRMVYECAPIAMLVEQAGGRATTGPKPLLDQCPDQLHARTPLIFGTPEKVDRVTAYHERAE